MNIGEEGRAVYLYSRVRAHDQDQMPVVGAEVWTFTKTDGVPLAGD
jgi:hypothetical protein